jgi:hypothetical protein
MIKTYEETPLTCTFLCKLNDKTLALRLFKKRHFGIIQVLKRFERKKKEMFFEEFAGEIFTAREYTPNSVYSEFDYLKTLSIQIL